MSKNEKDSGNVCEPLKIGIWVLRELSLSFRWNSHLPLGSGRTQGSMALTFGVKKTTSKIWWKS